MDNLKSVTTVKFKPKIHINRRTMTIIICSVIFAIILTTFIAGLCITDNMVAPNFSQKNLAPSFSHLFGTDWLGRDMFLRTIKGLSLSIIVGTVGSAVSAVLATIIGIAAAMGSKWLDAVINWTVDLVMGIPHLVLLIFCVWQRFNRLISRTCRYSLDQPCTFNAKRSAANTFPTIYCSVQKIRAQ